jgi:PAS domain S-box-containing protein
MLPDRTRWRRNTDHRVFPELPSAHPAGAMRLLVVDDDAFVRQLVTSRLEMQGVSVTAAATVVAALTELNHTTFDVAILDLSLPDGSGLDVLRTLRARGSPTHVIILSGAGGETDRLRGFELGADDYVVKPFFVRELAARVLAVRRRHDIAEDTRLQYGPTAIDFSARQVTVDGAPVSLTTKEFDLLAFLAARPRHVFSHDELRRSVWQSAADLQDESTVTEFVHRLRSKIELDPRQPPLLQTVRGAGYRFVPPSDQAEQGSTISSAQPQEVEQGTVVLVDGRIVSADEAAADIVGVASAAELFGRDLLDFVAPQSLIAARARQGGDASGRLSGSQILAMKRADRPDLYVEVSSSRTEWDGMPAGRLTIRPSTDPSVRLRHLVTGVFSELSDAVIITDPHLHVRSWNQAAERLYGWAEHEVLGRHLFDVVPLAEDNNQLGTAMQVLEETGRWYGEGQQVARDGSVVTVSASTALLRDDAGEPVVFVSVNRPAAARPALVAPPPTDTQDESEIRRGLDRDEFDVHYQPVVALDDLHIVTVEALVRWNHPDRGVLTPGSFMDNAERSSLILELGRVVLDKACRQTAQWRRAGSNIDLAVNLSTKQLAQPALFDDIVATLTVSGLDPRALWLEVTETALVVDVDQATDLLDRLAALGIRIAIDDFGTGWASLTYLKQFPVHALKIDRTFVVGVDHNPQDAAIARSILSLGEELGLVVIAEGIETGAQHAALRALGCSAGQGFLYGKPAPAAAVAIQRTNRF